MIKLKSIIAENSFKDILSKGLPADKFKKLEVILSKWKDGQTLTADEKLIVSAVAKTLNDLTNL